VTVSAVGVGLASVFLVDASRRLGWRLRSPDIALAMATSSALLAGAIVWLLEALRIWGGFSPLTICLSALSLWLATVYACRPYPGSDQPGYKSDAWLYLAVLVAATSGAALLLPDVRGPAGVARLFDLWVAMAGGPGRLATIPALAMIGAGGTLTLTALQRPLRVAAPIALALALVPLLAPAGAISQDDLMALGSATVLLGLGTAGLRGRPGRSGALVGGVAAGLGAGSRSPLVFIVVPLAMALIVELVRTVSSPKWAGLAVSGFLMAAAATGLLWWLSPVAATYPA
jgi:hypothetical protein